MTGRPHIMDDFRQEILNTDDYKIFFQVISGSNKLNDKNTLSLSDLIKLVERSPDTAVINEIMGLRIKEFKANFELVTRFSFFHNPIQQGKD